MSVLAFFENERQQIRKVVDYANHNIYQVDDILDMMNNQMVTPGEIPEHFGPCWYRTLDMLLSCRSSKQGALSLFPN